MGRPKLEVDLTKLKALASYGATKKMCADVLGVSEDTLENRLKEHNLGTYKEFADAALGSTRIRLMTKAITMADQGNVTMLIFCLKNLCQWTDKVQVNTQDDKPFELAYKPKSVRDVTPKGDDE